MGRPERDLNPEKDPLHRFAAELRKLRVEAGKPSYRELAKRAHFSVTALAEAAGGAVLPSLAVTLAYVEACGGDRREWEERWHALNGLLKGAAGQEGRPGEPGGHAEPGGPGGRDGPEGAPYLGLRTYRTEDARLFVGRETLVSELRDRLDRTSFLAVFGPSGVGKSSLLRAGLLPALRAERAPGGGSWRVAFLTPGERPLRELAVHLANAANVAAAPVLDALRAGPSSARTAMAQALAAPPAPPPTAPAPPTPAWWPRCGTRRCWSARWTRTGCAAWSGSRPSAPG
ncbi:helix-turn-helix domain-containing protein [Nonomuraea candida]|uniref:helix-turn-helix domain-containing protein n=1 Tax=Nonomuraea candida TaxID=359159 RepID=UPI000693F53C|nr:helix-turn-helix transcriptional regulator [Nonomuraea candida]